MLAAVHGYSILYSSRKITYSAIRHACNRMGIACDLHMCHKVFASRLHDEGIQPEAVDKLQGHVSQSVLTDHYLVFAKELREKNLSSLDSLDRLLKR
jgi:intergrase/recombinase